MFSAGTRDFLKAIPRKSENQSSLSVFALMRHHGLISTFGRALGTYHLAGLGLQRYRIPLRFRPATAVV